MRFLKTLASRLRMLCKGCCLISLLLAFSSGYENMQHAICGFEYFSENSKKSPFSKISGHEWTGLRFDRTLKTVF